MSMANWSVLLCEEGPDLAEGICGAILVSRGDSLGKLRELVAWGLCLKVIVLDLLRSAPLLGFRVQQLKRTPTCSAAALRVDGRDSLTTSSHGR